jgi:hypothetical protein
MKIRSDLPEISAYVLGSVVLGFVGSAHLAHGFDDLSALSAGIGGWASLLVWTGAIAGCGAGLGALLAGRNWRFHVPAALFLGLMAARVAAPEPRTGRIEPILADLPGWAWAFAAETAAWAGLLAAGVIAAGRAAAWVGGSAAAAPASPETAPLSTAAWPNGSDTPVARRLQPGALRFAQAATLIAGLLLVLWLLHSEGWKAALFAVTVAFLTASSAVRGFWPAGAVWPVMFLPAGVGVAVYVYAGLIGGVPDREALLVRPALFTLPIDWVAAGGLGALLGTRPGGFQDLVFSLTARAEMLRDRLTAPLDGEATPAPAARPARPEPAPAAAGSAPTAPPEPRGKGKGRRKKR